MSEGATPKKAIKFLMEWMDGKADGVATNVWTYREREGMRKLMLPALQEVVLDHLIGLHVIEKIGGLPKAAAFIRNRLPVDKKIRSADFGEILAAEYVTQATDFFVPVKKLRYRDDRSVAMRGDDVIGVRQMSGHRSVLKIEAKSRATLSSAVVKEASDSLMKHSGRPNPATLAFISNQLRLQAADTLAEMVERLQSEDIAESQIHHLIFTCSGNEPLPALKQHSLSPNPKLTRVLVGTIIVDHQQFIKAVFESLNA